MQTLHASTLHNPPRVLFICGSLNQTTQLHAVARALPGVIQRFTPYYGDRSLEALRALRALEFTILGNAMVERCLQYLHRHALTVDYRGREGDYDLVVTCSDLVVPRNIRQSRIVLVQEGMTDPESALFDIVRRMPTLPRWIASTAATGLSHAYDAFCVASDGYRDLFIRKGVDPVRLRVTGIPNFDDCASFHRNDFPLRGHVLVCTSDLRETGRRDDRAGFIRSAMRIAGDRQLVFKLHPNENVRRATAEIRALAPDATVLATGDTNAMIANADVLVTQYSSTVFVGLALGKEVHSYFDLRELRTLLPVQHGRAAENIAGVCRDILASAHADATQSYSRAG